MTSHIGDLRHIKIWTTYNACNLVISHLICFFTVTNTFHFYGSFLVVQMGAITKWHDTKDWKGSEKCQQHKSEPTMLFATPRNTQLYLQWFLLSLHPASCLQHQEIPSFIFSDFCYPCILRPFCNTKKYPVLSSVIFVISASRVPDI